MPVVPVCGRPVKPVGPVCGGPVMPVGPVCGGPVIGPLDGRLAIPVGI